MLEQHPDDRDGESDVAERGRDHDEAGAPDTLGQLGPEGPDVARGPSGGQRGQQRRHDRNGEDRVGQLEEDVGRRVGRVPASNLARQDDDDQQQHLVRRGVGERPAGEPSDPAEAGVLQVEDPPPPKVELAERRPQEGRHGDDAQRRPNGQDVLLRRGDVDGAAAGARHQREGQERGGRDQVVGDRGEHRRRELSPGVQQAGGDAGAQPIEDDLGHEPSEEEGGEGAFGLALAAGGNPQRVQVDDQPGADHGQHRDRAEDDEGERHDRAGSVPGALLVSALEPFHEHRDEDR